MTEYDPQGGDELRAPANIQNEDSTGMGSRESEGTRRGDLASPALPPTRLTLRQLAIFLVVVVVAIGMAAAFVWLVASTGDMSGMSM